MSLQTLSLVCINENLKGKKQVWNWDIIITSPSIWDYDFLGGYKLRVALKGKQNIIHIFIAWDMKLPLMENLTQADI